MAAYARFDPERLWVLDKRFNEAKRQLMQDGGCTFDGEQLINLIQGVMDNTHSEVNFTPQTSLGKLIGYGYGELLRKTVVDTWFQSLGDFGWISEAELGSELGYTSDELRSLSNLISLAGVEFDKAWQKHQRGSTPSHPNPYIQLPFYQFGRIGYARFMNHPVGHVRGGTLNGTEVDIVVAAGFRTYGEIIRVHPRLFVTHIREEVKRRFADENEIEWPRRIGFALRDWFTTVYEVRGEERTPLDWH